MGEHEGWAALQPPNGLLPNGLLPNEAASVIQMLDSERWMKAEERTADLIACIQPDAPSEGRRNDVADYVQRLITKCFPCQVFAFGSVPLKTYLPDGDIDLMAFSKNQNLKDMWAHQVRDMLENEEKNENAEFRVKEVQYIQAEVKIIKCLVENIVVDISFNQLGGLCTLCFLEENHLFKRSIILIKAWCYYESRILGAHHGLISTYALETLVLYIFHVFNKSFSGPLEVLYRFLEFFSKFDWENFCVSLWGPVPISSLPEITAEPPRKDGGELLLSKYFLDTCSSRYAVCQENQGQPFVSKHFNVIDPLRINNNLGRSVSKGGRKQGEEIVIGGKQCGSKRAFSLGAKKLARLLDCPKEDLFQEVNQFFMNTWERHGSSQRPDAPRNDLWCLRLSKADQTQESKNVWNNSICKVNDISSRLQTQGSCSVSSQHVIHPSESTTKVNEISTVSCAQSQKGYGSICNSKISDQVRWVSNSNQNVHSSTGQNISKAETSVTDVRGRYLFARTRSSPELTETCGEFTSQGRQNGVPESGKTQIASVRTDKDWRKNMDSYMVASYNIKSSGDTSSSVRCTSTRQSMDTAAEPNSPLNGCQDDSGLGSTGQDFSSILGAQGMHQEKQDLVNMMPSSAVHGFNGQVPFPLNLAAGDLPFPIHSLSMGYDQINLGRLVPTNIEMFPQGLISCPFANYFSGIGLPSNSEDPPGEVEHKLWHEQDRGPNGGFDLDNGSFEILQSDDKQLSTSPRVGSSDNSTKVQHKFSEDIQGSTREDHIDVCQYQDNRGGDVYFEERIVSSRHLAVSHASSYRSKTSSESSLEGLSAKIPKPSKEKQGRKTAASVLPSAAGRKGKIVSEHSSQADDGRDWNSPSIPGTEMAERTTGSETAQTNGSDPLIPVAPFPLGPGSGKRTTDNSGLSTLAFTITGPPVPFLFCPFHNIPADTGTPDASTSHVSWDEGSDNTDSGLNFESSERLDQSEVLSTSSSMRKVMSLEPAEHKSDILNGDIASHWQNLQYGRFCQSSRFSPPRIYPSPVVVPPIYLQGHFPLDGPGRPLPSNLSLSQLMNYGPRIFPVAPLQSVSSRPASLYQRYVDEMPRYRSGTGTYLPNPKASVRERHSANSRREKHNYDRNGQQGDREGNWSGNSKYRAAGCSQSHNQNEKSKFSFDQLVDVGGESRTERPCGSPMNLNGVSSNGPPIPSVVMLYPYDHNSACGSPAEPLDNGSLGTMGFLGMNEVSQLSNGRSSGGVFDKQIFHGTSAQRF
ncbi:hypothetical protein Gogos_022293 [Gossypium gossypioides]|uniref:Polymerase nucleotidyl transferase domain-containing protein n=1 Tax=Gossypium gossypioides TaxID=34282 RepID=A0A7J9CXX8_GOSGO|nr:hypothetical protein [Gossypium gossypioides]